MKKIIALIALALIVFAVVYRQRLFLRDPLGSVTRDGVKEDGAQVFINWSNDVLLENDNPPGARPGEMTLTLIQHARPIGLPKQIHCLHWMLCMTDADPATLVAPDPGAFIRSMNNKQVAFHDYNGREAVVTLR
jgi:hypothetical protein